MKSNRSSSKGQLGLKFRADSGLPFAVSLRSIERGARSQLGTYLKAESSKLLLFELRSYIEKVSLLRELRRKYRLAVRSRGGAAVYAGTPEGRRAHRVIDTLTLEIAAAERTSLCG